MTVLFRSPSGTPHFLPDSLASNTRTIYDLAPSYFSKTISWHSHKFSLPSGHGAYVPSCLPALPLLSSAWNAVPSLLNIANLLHPLKQSSSLPHLCSHSPLNGAQGTIIVCYKCSHPRTSLSLTRLIAPSEKSYGSLISDQNSA